MTGSPSRLMVVVRVMMLSLSVVTGAAGVSVMISSLEQPIVMVPAMARAAMQRMLLIVFIVFICFSFPDFVYQSSVF